MKQQKGFYYFIMALVLSLGFSLVSCGDSDDDEPSASGGGTTYDWSTVSGKYLSKPTRTDYGYGSIKYMYLDAKGLEVKQNYVVHYPSVSNCKYMVPNNPYAFSDFSGGESIWRGDLNNYYDFGVSLSGNRLLIMDDNWKSTGNYLTLTEDGVEYNGVKYYRPEVFNANINSWIGGQAQSQPQPEQVSVSMSTLMTNNNYPWSVSYDVTVRATGSGFTVKSVTISNTAGANIYRTVNTSDTEVTIGISYTGRNTPTIQACVTTTSGNKYYSAEKTL